MIEKESGTRMHKSTKSVNDESDFAIHGSAITTTATDTDSSDTAGNTFIIKGRKQALQEAYSRSLKAKHSYYYVTGEELAKSYKPFLPLLRLTVQHGGSSRIITNIEKETISAVKELSEAGGQVRHIDSSGLRRCVIYDNTVAYFSIVEEPIITAEAIENVNQTEGEDLWISSSEPSIIQSAKRRFLIDWKENTISATERINKLEGDIESEFIKVITSTENAGEILLHLTQSAKKEVLSLIPTSRGMLRMERLGAIDSLIEASKRGAIVKIICPISKENSHIATRISEQAPAIKVMNAHGDAPVGMTIADSEKLFQAEVKNPEAHTFPEAIGFAIYSNTKRNIKFFKSFFELLWNERVLNEELKNAYRMQREFTNIASHELRTPVQAILGMSVLLQNYPEKGNEMIEVIRRNAKRLQTLTEDILDVTKIENNSLQLKKEKFNIYDILSDVIKDFTERIKSDNKNIKLVYDQKDTTRPPIIVEGDNGRITQVLSNILNNALKFTNEGHIIVKAHESNNKKEVTVSITDTGSGINEDIFAKLFSKFPTKSFSGTGLGLYISKSIVEAQGGRIWAENNKDKVGATFMFTLPVVSRE
jgi:two-component system sensor histidine kinase VicK